MDKKPKKNANNEAREDIYIGAENDQIQSAVSMRFKCARSVV